MIKYINYYIIYNIIQLALLSKFYCFFLPIQSYFAREIGGSFQLVN